MREMLKRTVRALCLLLVLPMALPVRLRRDLQAFQGAGQLLALVPGLGGRYLRWAFYRLTLVRCPVTCVIEFGSYFSHWDVELGDHVYIGAYCIVARCTIGENAMLGSGVHVLDGGRQHGTDLSGPSFQQQGHESVRVSLGSGCWVGNQAVVMADLGPQTIVGAGAVVAKATRGNEVVVGVPARSRSAANRE